MRYLVTGGAGFVGSRLVARLKETGEEVLTYDSRAGGNLLYHDLPLKIDVVYHLAAHKSVEESWIYPLLYAENLAMMMRIILVYPNARIIHSSSCAADQPETSPYAFFKWAASNYLKMYHKNYVDLIFPNIFGGQQKQNSVVDIFKNAQALTVHDPKIVRDYVHVDDIVEGLLKAQNWPVGDYSMGSGIGTTLLQLAKGKKIKFEEARREDFECKVINNTPDWKPKIKVLEYIK